MINLKAKWLSNKKILTTTFKLRDQNLKHQLEQGLLAPTIDFNNKLIYLLCDKIFVLGIDHSNTKLIPFESELLG